ncbi:hypothetical protein Tco_0558094 [Tanacetum coccineum]
MFYAHIGWSRISICKSDLRDDCDSSFTLATSAITILFVALNTFLSALLAGQHQVMLAAMTYALARQHDSETAKYFEEVFALRCFDVCLLPWGCWIPFCSIVSDLDAENVFCFGIRDGGKILSVGMPILPLLYDIQIETMMIDTCKSKPSLKLFEKKTNIELDISIDHPCIHVNSPQQ